MNHTQHPGCLAYCVLSFTSCYFAADLCSGHQAGEKKMPENKYAVLFLPRPPESNVVHCSGIFPLAPSPLHTVHSVLSHWTIAFSCEINNLHDSLSKVLYSRPSGRTYKTFSLWFLNTLHCTGTGHLLTARQGCWHPSLHPASLPPYCRSVGGGLVLAGHHITHMWAGK